MTLTLRRESEARGTALRAAAACIPALQLACAAATRPIPLRQSNLPYPVGVCYRAGRATGDGAKLAESDFDADLATCARLGVNTFFMCDPPDDAWTATATAARSHGLEPVKVVGALEMTGAGRQVVTGYEVSGLPIELVFAVPQDREQASPRGGSRAAQFPGPRADLAEAPDEPPAKGMEPAPAAGDSQNSSGAEPGRAILHLLCERTPGEEALATVARWWMRFHVGLVHGLTAGLAFDRIPGIQAGTGAADGANEPMAVEYAAALKGIAARMQAWGPMLDRFALRPVPDLPEPIEGLQIALFARDRRRLLLLVNRSAERVLRSTLTLPARLDGQTVSRLVQVPTGPGLEPGAVIRATRGRFSFPLEIGPGEAMLFEAFESVSDSPSKGGI